MTSNAPGHAARQIANALRLNPRKAWYRNLEEVTVEAMMRRLSRSNDRSRPFRCCSRAGYRRSTRAISAARNAHPSNRTGPFKFAEFKPNEYIRVIKNPEYWKAGRPYLDGIEWTVIPNRSTQTLAFIAASSI